MSNAGARNYAEFLGTANTGERQGLGALPWQAEPIAIESVSAEFSPEAGLVSLSGSMPFIETPAATAAGTGKHLKSELLAQFLVQNRALFRGYVHEAHRQKYAIVGDYEPAYLAQVSSEIAGMEGANFAVFLAAQLAVARGGKTLLIDADTHNQFLFPLLSLKDTPRVLTENLQKPSSFRNDLTACIVTLSKEISYLNLQAPSLRPFSDSELSRICAFLDADFANIVIYSGQMVSPWLSANAQVNFAIGNTDWKSELKSLARHREGAHTVLLARGRERFFPCLTTEFATRQTLDFWREVPHELTALRNFVRRVTTLNRVAVGGNAQSEGFLSCHTGLGLYLRYADYTEAEADKVLSRLQGRLRAYYPKTAFFSERSIHRNIRALPNATATTILETGDNVQLVSLMQSAELRATAIFPSGILRPLKTGDLRISACSADGFLRFREIACRGGFDRVLTVPRVRLKNPNALGAVMEQLQA